MIIKSEASLLLQSEHENWFGKLKDLFSFLAGASKNHAFREHLHHLVTNYNSSPSLLSEFFTDGLLLDSFIYLLFSL